MSPRSVAQPPAASRRRAFAAVPALAVLLLVSCAAPPPDWVEVGKGSRTVLYVLSSSTTYYIDPKTVAREGNRRKVWEIHDLSDRESQGERSILAEVEYDCGLDRMRTVAATGHSRAMGSGEIIPLRHVSDDWVALKRNRTDDAVFLKILDRVCAH